MGDAVIISQKQVVTVGCIIIEEEKICMFQYAIGEIESVVIPRFPPITAIEEKSSYLWSILPFLVTRSPCNCLRYELCFYMIIHRTALSPSVMISQTWGLAPTRGPRKWAKKKDENESVPGAKTFLPFIIITVTSV